MLELLYLQLYHNVLKFIFKHLLNNLQTWFVQIKICKYSEIRTAFVVSQEVATQMTHVKGIPLFIEHQSTKRNTYHCVSQDVK